jgi:hypothetical protein
MRDKLVVGAATLLAGIAAGTAAGWYFGAAAGRTAILNEWIYNDARDVQAQVVVLRSLREKKADQAIELLEARLDDQLIQFDPQQPLPALTPRETGEMRKAIVDAKDYRAGFPRQSKRKAVDEMVRNLFARDLYK